MPAFLDGLFMGLGFTIALTVIGAVRESSAPAPVCRRFAAAGPELQGGELHLLPAHMNVLMMILPPGGFIATGLMVKSSKRVLDLRAGKRNPDGWRPQRRLIPESRHEPVLFPTHGRGHCPGGARGWPATVAGVEPEQTTSCGHCASSASCSAHNQEAAGMGTVASRLQARRFMITTPAAAREVAQSQRYDQHIPPSGEDEIGRLVDSFNDMLGELRARDASLREHQEHLEELVEGRTAELRAAKEQAEAASQAKSEFLACQ